jgi:hypothetical protein
MGNKSKILTMDMEFLRNKRGERKTGKYSTKTSHATPVGLI